MSGSKMGSNKSSGKQSNSSRKPSSTSPSRGGYRPPTKAGLAILSRVAEQSELTRDNIGEIVDDAVERVMNEHDEF